MLHLTSDLHPIFQRSGLLGLLMKSVLLAESAVLSHLNTLGMCLLILGCVIVAALALCACQCNSCTHSFVPP